MTIGRRGTGSKRTRRFSPFPSIIDHRPLTGSLGTFLAFWQQQKSLSIKKKQQQEGPRKRRSPDQKNVEFYVPLMLLINPKKHNSKYSSTTAHNYFATMGLLIARLDDKLDIQRSYPARFQQRQYLVSDVMRPNEERTVCIPDVL